MCFRVVYNSVGNVTEARKSSGSGEENLDENKRWSVKYVVSHLGTDSLPKCDLINYLQDHADSAFLRKWKLTGSTKSIRKNRNCSQLVSAYKEFCKLYSPVLSKRGSASTSEQTSLVRKSSSSQSSVVSGHTSLDSVEDILKLVRLLYSISTTSMEEFGENADENYGFIIPSEEFSSKKITTKLIQQIKDPLMSSSGSLPSWCENVMSLYPMLFPFDTRQMYFNSTAFGCARTIIWLQTSRDAAVERSRTPSSRRDDQHEFSIGRLKHERIRISRDDGLLGSAIRVLNFHSERKAILEFEFEGEEGTGLGPTLEFYSLVAAALQEKSLGIFLCDDDTHDHVEQEVDIGHGIRAPGYYIQRAGGLFPAPLPQDGSEIERVCKLFTFLGIFLAKSLQDNRLVDLPLSRSFLKLLCNGGGDNSMVPTLPTTHGHASHLSLAEGLEDSCSYEEERESVRNLTTNELDRFRKLEEDENDINKLECELSKVSLIEEDLPKEQPKETENLYEPAIIVTGSAAYWMKMISSQPIPIKERLFNS
ncbi:E3 ubiquitin- ligase HECTD1-like isoform X1 [Paramuricea clavata]|uniref:E3 ubiquitin-protein ligase n=1 Tax=Paramuricea clavata TaxID=317549 RepID=A0A6S7HTX0_PARCT|nr:E3 ubiquitin- ligase HECTD1-like isoform X1 [Paramuricea clavata]